MVHATSSGSLSSVMPNGPLISHSASTASLQNLAMGEPPPCRTIFVRNIDPNTDDMQLQATFEVNKLLLHVHAWLLTCLAALVNEEWQAFRGWLSTCARH